jgi:hypothetical protein
LSFWVTSNSHTGTFAGAIRNTAGNRSYPFTYTIPAVGVWYKIVITIPGDTVGPWVWQGNASSMSVGFATGCGATYSAPGPSANTWQAGNFLSVAGAVSINAVNGGTWFITGVKFEIGSVATPFNRQTMDECLSECERYYQTFTNLMIYTYATAGVAVYASWAYRTAMRITPTVTFSNINYSNASALALWTANLQNFGCNVTCTAQGNCYGYFFAQCSAEL